MDDIERQCWGAFVRGEKDRAAALLSKVQQPLNFHFASSELVYWAAVHGWDDLCRLLVDKYQFNPAAKGRSGMTPLQLACQNGHTRVVEYLLTLPTVLVTVNDEDVRGWTALYLACVWDQLPVIEILMREPSINMPTKRLYSGDFDVLSLLSTRMEWSTDFPVQPKFNVFMAGNSGAGKTSLTTVMKNLDYFSSSFPLRHGLVSGVKTLTAGVCPTSHSGEFWLIKDNGDRLYLEVDTHMEIYDMAGHPEYYSSHSAMLDSLCLESPAVFVLMLDLTKSEKELSKQIFKWTSFIEIASNAISAHVIVVGSRKDVLFSEPELLARKCKFVEDTAKDALEKQHYAGFAALDTRLLSSENVHPFLSILINSINALAIPGAEEMSFSCHLLHAFLEQVVEAKAISFDSLQGLVSRHATLSSFFDPATLTSSLRTLADKGLILFFHNTDHSSFSCIIIDKAKLLQEINGTLFAPRDFEEHCSLASNTGIVPVGLLCKIFPHYSEFLVPMLTSLQFCRLVEPALSNNITTNLSLESATDSQLLYFPALVNVERPEHLSIIEGFGWCMYCTNRRHRLTQRCCDAILLDTTYTRCLSMPPPPDTEHPNEALVRELCRSCKVWKNGVYWMTVAGTEAVVQISEENHCVSLLVSSNQECRTNSLELCSSVIDSIRSKQKELCSSVGVHEYLISPSQLIHVPHRNFSELTVFAMEDVAKSVRDKELFVFDVTREKRISLKSLLHFDPQEVPPPTAVQQLFPSDKTSKPVPASFSAGENRLEPADLTATNLTQSPGCASCTSPPPPTPSIASAGVSASDCKPPPKKKQRIDSNDSEERPESDTFLGVSVEDCKQPRKKQTGDSSKSEEQGGSKAFLDVEPKEEDLWKLVATNISNYHGLGIMLGLGLTRVEMLEKEQRGNVILINMKILNTWISEETKTPTTWCTLVGVLHNLDMNSLAHDITEKLKKRLDKSS